MSTISASTTSTTAYKVTADTTGTLVLQTGATPTTAVTIDGSQNVGVGVTPSAWSTIKGLQVYGAGFTGTANNAYVSANTYFDGTNFKYINSDYATYYTQQTGKHVWYYAASGISGATATMTQAMTLDASGQLGIGATSVTAKLDVLATYSSDTASQQRFRDNTGVSLNLGGTGGGKKFLQAQDSAGSATYYDILINPLGGNLLVGSSTDPFSSGARLGVFKSGSIGDTVSVYGSYTSYYAVPFGVYVVDTNDFNNAGSAVKVGRNSVTGRSLNAGGTVNASGADYAEYMVKSGNFNIAKGDVVGINAEGRLTNVFADAVSFCVKSTDPSYVGGDTWGVELEGDALEAARQTVDRIAFAGQVPVNVTGATAGQYIVSINDNGAIKGVAVSNPTFEQYQQAVGKVIAIEQDGRARIIVKVA
jgi:hypothetical protein